MNTERASGRYNQLSGEIKKTWGKLTDDDISLYRGNVEKFYGKVKEKYGIAKEIAEERMKEIESSINKAA